MFTLRQNSCGRASDFGPKRSSIRKGPHVVRRFSTIILLALINSLVHAQQTVKGPEPQGTIRAESGSPIIDLSFKDFFESGASGLKPSRKLLGLTGKRVRIIGFMSQMEDPQVGAFYLCPRPVFADESGGGTADLPPEDVLVLAPSSHGKKISFMPGRLEIVGVLEVGRREETDGRVSFVRLVLNKPEPIGNVAPAPLHK